MNSVTFGSINSFETWGLFLKSKPVISPPEPKYKLIEVPGSNTVIDLTESLTGEVTYRPREMKCEFITTEKGANLEQIRSDVLNEVHGKRMEIRWYGDNQYYYIGRVTVGEIQYGKGAAVLPVVATVEPYRYEINGTGRKL